MKCVPAGVEKVWKMVAPAPPGVPAAGAAAAMAPMVSGVPLPERSASIRESRRETILVRWLVLSCSPPPPDGGWGGARPNAWSPGVVLGALSAVNDIRALPAKVAPRPGGAS